jgi:hypothetical protein
LTGEVPDKFLDRLKVFKKAFDESLIAEDRIFIFTAGQKATTDLFEKAEESIMCLKIIDYNLLDGLPEFIESISQYNSPHQSDLYSLLIRLKLSQQYRGIFLTPDNALPISIFREKLVVDETGVLLQTPIYKNSINQYVYPGNIFASLGTEGKATLLLDDFLNNLKVITQDGSNIGEYESIFTKSVNYALLDYDEYLNYYKSANQLNGDLYLLRYSGIKFTDNINNYYGQLNRLLTKNTETIWSIALNNKVNPTITLLNDPESIVLMQKFNVELVKVKGDLHLMFPTNSDVRELYSYKSLGNNIGGLEKTGLLAYIDNMGIIELYEVKKTILPPEDMTHYHPSTCILVPLDDVLIRNSGKLGNDCRIVVDASIKKVFYNVDLQCWGIYNTKDWGKEKLTHSVVREKKGWKIWNQRESLSAQIPSKERELINLSPVPKVPHNLYKLRKEINFFVQDLSFESKIEKFKKVPGVIIHYDIDQELYPSLSRIIENNQHFKWNNVRTDSSFHSFFLESELGGYYEAARENKFLDVAYYIMQYQIIKERGGIFAPYWKAAIRPLQSSFKASFSDILLKFPRRKLVGNSVEYELSNEIIVCHKQHSLFSKMNEEIVNALKKDGEYFGKILKDKSPGSTVFPTNELVGSKAFHKIVMNNVPEIRALITYLNEEFTTIVYYREYEAAKAHFFPFLP